MNAVRRAWSRNRTDIAVWAVSVLIIVFGSVAAALLIAPAVALVSTVVGGAVRLAFEIGRRERVADIREELAERATDAIAEMTERHVLHRGIWTDEAALEELKRRIINARAGVALGPPSLVPRESDWTIQSVVEAGADALDVRTRTDSDWLRIGSELQKTHDAYAAAVGPYMPDLDESARRFVSAILIGLSDAKQWSEHAFVLQHAPERAPQERISEAGRSFYTALQFVYTAAHRLGARPRV